MWRRRPRYVRRAPPGTKVAIGSIGGIAAEFQALRQELGISSIMVGDMDELAPVVERLAGT